MTGLTGRDQWTVANVNIGQTVHLADGNHVVADAATDRFTHERHLWFADGGHVVMPVLSTVEVRSL